MFGAAAAIGKPLRLDRLHMVWALGNTAAQSAGLIESFGSMKSISVGNAARNGFTAALASPWPSWRSKAKVMSDDWDLGAITDGLGTSWEILSNACKPYPCGVVLLVGDPCYT